MQSDPPPAPNSNRKRKFKQLARLMKRAREDGLPAAIEAAQSMRNGGWKRWIVPAALLLIAAFIGLSLLGKAKKEVWTYYTDDQGIEAEFDGEKARYVLWQDPEAHSFDDSGSKGDPDTPAESANKPGGQLEAAFSPDGTQMILVRWQAAGSNADMFLSLWNGRTWSKPKALNTINTPSNERGPAFSRDGRFLYFSSDRADGAGGYDLYVARWDGKQWNGIASLGANINSSEDESGPAVSSDDSKLFFSSNRSGAREEDIFIAERMALGEQEGNLPPIPGFHGAETVSHLNSRDQDIQAALTSRGDHVFLASDRDSKGDKGYSVYLSRVIDGVSRKPERVDLYISKGNVTDPAVRMDGFDLLFSADHESVEETGENYRLYRSTTREVIGYTDLKRWEQFKELMDTIGWWIFLALAALIALIYLLESWRDISSLFHKCLAGSAAAHLLMLLIFAVLVIAKEVEKQALPPAEVLVSLDAITEEELALESVPEETEITQPDLAHESEKAAADFDIPNMEAQENAQAVPIDAEFQQQAMEVEVKTASANPTEEHNSEPSEPSALLSELSESELPEPDQPVLDEREFAEAPEAADPSESEFAPNETAPTSERSESETVADAAVETPTEATEVEPSETIADNPATTPLTEVNPAQAQAEPTETPAELESELLAEIPETNPLETEPLELEENPNPNSAPANPAQDTFDPTEAVAATSSQAQSDTVSDAAAESQAEASEVAGGGIESAVVAEGPAAAVGEAQSESDVPDAAPEAGPASDLPASALLDPGAPQLDEGEPNPNPAPANPAADAFNPNNALTEATSSPAEGNPVNDAAVANQTDTAEVSNGEIATTPVTTTTAPTVGEAQAEESVPEAALQAGIPSDLPENALLDPGAPQLDEGEPNPNAEPANPSQDTFNPAGVAATNTTTPVDGNPVADAAVANQAAAAEVASGAVAQTEAPSGPSAAVGEAQAEEAVPASEINSGINNELPATALLDPGAPQLDEGENKPAGNPGDESFKPESGSALAAKQGSDAASDSAESAQADSSEVGKGELAATEATEGSAAAVGEAEAAEGLPGASPSALAGNLPESSTLDPGAPTLDEGPQRAVGGAGNEKFEPGSGAVASKQGSEAARGSAESAQAEAAEIGKGQLDAPGAAEGSAAAVGEAETEEGVPGASPSALAGNLPESSPLDPGAPTLDEGPQNAGGAAQTEEFKPGRGSVASQDTERGASRGSAATSEVDADAVQGSGLLAEASGLTNPQSGLESGASDSEATAGEVGAAALEPTLTASLLPGKLDAPELDAGAMTNFLKKQNGRPSLDVIKQLGGSDGTEKAIRASIQWLAENQEDDGRWDSKKHGAKGKFDTGNTGLSLLCFYGWGARHDRDSKYRNHVKKALDYLISIQSEDGDLGGGGLMYCHAIASIALCEAYGITKDPRLREPAQRSIDYTLAAQSKTKGGWRYHPGNDSDTSITGWQYMALHSAKLAGLKVPQENFDRARGWLDRAGGGKHGGLYGYQGPAKNSPAMIATGMFCRQLDLVPPGSGMQIESANQLKRHPMESRRLDYYYIYYATLALYQHQGPIWDKWNEQLKDTLPRIQEKTGSKKGSWEASRGLAGNGGRVASTALATLSLEVYYRILPIYGFRGDEEAAPEVKRKEGDKNEEGDE